MLVENDKPTETVIPKDSITRLRASRIEGARAEMMEGNGAGRFWAEEVAEWSQIERVTGANPLDSGYVDGPGSYSHFVLEAIFGDGEGRNNRSFWGEVFEEPSPSLAWLQGFMQGVSDFYEEVEPQVNVCPSCAAN